MNKYLFVKGVKVSGYIQYTGVEILKGRNVDHAFNLKYLNAESPHNRDCVVMEVYAIDEGEDYAGRIVLNLRKVL